MTTGELTEEQKEKAKALETPEELLAYAKEEGIELADEQLDAISGGYWSTYMSNPVHH